MKLLIVLFTFLLTCTVTAAPTIYGPTGLITVPTAESLQYKEFNIAYDYRAQANSTTADNDLWNYKLNIGTFQNWELGVMGGSTPTEGMFLNVKYYLISDNARFPLSIAIGADNLSSLSNSSIYMVCSKKLRSDWGVHLGFKSIFAEDQLTPSIMGGSNYMVSERIEVLGDINGDGIIYSGNVGMRFYINPELILRGYYTDLGAVTDEGSYISFGISFSKFL